MSQLFEVITVSGPDARTFLQGQLTQDVQKLDEKPLLLAAWCNPKGRVIAVMRMVETAPGQNIALLVPFGLGSTVLKRLLVFRFRASVEMQLASDDWVACAVAGDDDIALLEAQHLLPGDGASVASHAGLVAFETRAATRCIEVFGPSAAFEKARLHIRQPLTSNQWQQSLIHAGIPTIGIATAEKYTPHMLNLDRLGAISFTKGCYTGQEIVARTEHLGKIKRRVMHFRTEAPGPETGARMRFQQQDVGDIVNAAGEHVLAVVPLELHGETLQIDGHPASPVPLPYPVTDQY